MRQVRVVALVRLLDSGPHRRGVSVRSGEVALLVHVGAADELHAKVEVEDAARVNFHRDHVLHAGQVVLEAVHDRHTLTPVHLVSQLLPEGFNSALQEALLRIDVKNTAAFVREFREVVRPAFKTLEFLEILLGQASKLLSELAFEGAHGSVKAEEVATHIATHVFHGTVDADLFNELLEIGLAVLGHTGFAEIVFQLCAAESKLLVQVTVV